MNASEPQKVVDDIWLHSYSFRRAVKFFGTGPIIEEATRVLNMIGRAVDRPLPDSIHASRGLWDISFLLDKNGERVGSRPFTPELMESLSGAVQVETGLMSTSLGADRAIIEVDKKLYPHKVAYDIPAGSRGLWMGVRGVYPDQRELILAPNTPYVISKARLDESGGTTIAAQVLPL